MTIWQQIAVCFYQNEIADGMVCLWQMQQNLVQTKAQLH